MQMASVPGAMKKFRRTAWRFQQTVHTPLQDLDRFVAVILEASGATSATATIDEVVFEPKNIGALIGDGAVEVGRDFSIEASGEEVPKLLKACFGDWVDFAFVPSPKPFVIYADHDEYATFFANSKAGLNSVIIPLREAGFELVEGWVRVF